MKLVRLLTFNRMGGNERILNGVYTFSGFHCHTILVFVCRSTLVRVWCKGDEPVRVGSKVLCNYEGNPTRAGMLEPVGVVIWHDGSRAGLAPWAVLTKFLNGKGFDYNYFGGGDLKVLDNYDSEEDILSASRDICMGEPTGVINHILSDLSTQFGKVHKELEDE